MKALAGVIFDSARQKERAQGPRVECRHARAADAEDQDPREQAALIKRAHTRNCTSPEWVAESLRPRHKLLVGGRYKA